MHSGRKDLVEGAGVGIAGTDELLVVLDDDIVQDHLDFGKEHRNEQTGSRVLIP